MSSPFRELLNRIESRVDTPAKEVSFARVGRAISKLNVALPAEGRGVILVAGTNGKGTISKTLETLFAARGEQVGLFTSPHLIKTTERIRSHGRDLTEEEFLEAYKRVETFVEAEGLSHFEILTLMMIEVFYGGRIRPRVDRAVIEVGVGGRWDPTRHLPHEVTVIAKLGFDHQSLLGAKLEDIARHKFDAIDPGNLVVHAPLPREIESVSEPYRKQSRWIEAAPRPYAVTDEPKWLLDNRIPLNLMGRRAIENVSVALKVFEELDLEPDLQALTQMEWPGRMEEVERRVYFSGDHNPQGISSLEEILEAFHFDRLWLVVGIGKNKEAREIFDVIRSWRFADRIRFILTRTPFRGGRLEDYGDIVKEAFACEEEPMRALALAKKQAKADDLILVTGSLYLIGYLKSQEQVKPIT